MRAPRRAPMNAPLRIAEYARHRALCRAGGDAPWTPGDERLCDCGLARGLARLAEFMATLRQGEGAA